MRTEHTPGPWVVEDLGDNCLSIKTAGGVHVEPEAKAELSDYYQRIGSVAQRDPHPSLAGGIPRAVTEANARLIAAAPELLGALQATLSLIRRNAPELSGKVLGEADAVIAKALGG